MKLMNNVVANARSIIIASIKADTNIAGRITKDLISDFISDHKVRGENNRHLTEDEKIDLFKSLSDYFRADLNWETDLVELEKGLTIMDPGLHEEWEPDDSNMVYWKKHREHLRSVLGRKYGQDESARIINSIDIETGKILRSMENPLRNEFDSRGMVVGYVQSGKTANFTALISKAVDAGYRFIIVLAGIHNELRQQTQIRIDREITGYNNLNLDGEFVQWDGFELFPRYRTVTSAGYLDGQESGEFSGQGVERFKDIFANNNQPVLAVIKKNVKIMGRLIRWINNSTEADRVNVPVLVIDDEADQASIDTNANRDADPTRTNASLRTILGYFPRKAYVGYTATPFANVFIKHGDVDDTFGEDLYPRNFIHSLPEPDGYFGTRRIFRGELDNFFVAEVTDARTEIRTLTETDALSEGLINAIYCFVVSMAIRYLRGQEMDPMSMMINVDHRVNRMNRIGEKLITFIGNTLKNHFSRVKLADTYKRLAEESAEINNGLGIENDLFSVETVVKKAVEIIVSGVIETRILNSNRADSLDYARNPSMKVIAVGGNKLSRGLTLEGLMTTFYLRRTRQFDTLLQMGRWFGYRAGYEDMVRIFTSRQLWDVFRQLAVVELEFRSEVKQMIAEDKTPADFFVGVRQIIGMIPTGRNKLGAAALRENLKGSQLSVKKFPLEKPEIIDDQISWVKELVASIRTFEKTGNIADYPSLTANNVQRDIVENFLIKFEPAVDEKGKFIDFDKNNLFEHLNSENYPFWNVAIISIGPNEDNNLIDLGSGYIIRAVNRSRLKLGVPENGFYNIKALAGKSDRKIDLPADSKDEYENREKPLLLIYIISRNSRPADSESLTREPLYLGIPAEKHRDPVGFTLVFPGRREGGIWIQN